MLPPDLNNDDSLLQGVAPWHFIFVQQSQERNTAYIRAGREVFKRPDRWEPWKDERIPAARFVELFRMSLADFNWFSDKLRDDLQQDPPGRGEPLTVEAQVAIGDSGYVTIKRFSTVLSQKLCYQRNKIFDCSKVLREDF
jgi:hypothetical protein